MDVGQGFFQLFIGQGFVAAGLFEQRHNVLGIGRYPARNHCRTVDVEVGVFVYLPGPGQASPELQVLIPVQETFEYLGFDFAAGAVGRQNRV